MDVSMFIAASVSLLATPGPTNTLLATAGASIGVRRALPLLGAEIAGYLAAILTLQLALGPIVAAAPALGIGLRLVAAAYLVHLAIKLWMHGAVDGSTAPVTLARVLVTTLLNPKAIIFAFTILPQPAAGVRLGPWLAGLAVMIVAIGGAWIVVGAALRRGFRAIVPAAFGYRLSAIALLTLAGVVTAQTFK